VIAQAADDLAFERIVNTPKRGLGDAALQMMHDFARKKRIPLSEAAALLSSTDEMKPKPRASLRALMDNFARWTQQKDKIPHTELAEIVLDESGYTEMWQKDRSADAAGRLENLKELVRSMEEFENLAGFLEHISLVMDRDSAEGEQAVNIMTLHSAKGLEFDTVFLPGWEEGLFPHQRSLDEQGRAGLEEERRLAHVGLTRARKRASIYFATNRRIHGMWTSTVPSRFLDELPAEHVEVTQAAGGAGGFGMSGYGPSRFDEMGAFGSNYTTPGWQRAQGRKGRGGFSENGQPRYVPDGVFDDPAYAEDGSGGQAQPKKAAKGAFTRHSAKRGGGLTIEGELVAKSTGAPALFAVGERVFHQKFGNGNVVAVDGNKLTIAFDKAGEKRVVDSFVERI
jgi:DNA helicase-2/ATP-dependent DNA helicase PcrA